MYLVRKLESFVKSKAIMFVKTPLKLRKTIGLVFYQFAHGVSSNNIANRFNVGVFTTLKYVDIVPQVLIFLKKLFSQHIFILPSLHLLAIIDRFFHAHGPPNVCGIIDGSHIPLFKKMDKWVIIAGVDYYCR
jgi:hypothetical protein